MSKEVASLIIRRAFILSAFAVATLGIASGEAFALTYPQMYTGPYNTMLVKFQIDRISNFVWIVLNAVAVTFFLVGGFKYLTAQGNAEQVKAASKMLVYGLVALAVGLAAPGLVFLVSQILGT